MHKSPLGLYWSNGDKHLFGPIWYFFGINLEAWLLGFDFRKHGFGLYLGPFHLDIDWSN